MNSLTPLETLYDPDGGDALPLPPELARLYGRLAFPPHPGRPYVLANFVASLDGVVSLGIPGQAGGGYISGGDAQDKMVMGLLRAVSDAIIIGAGTLRESAQHNWTPAGIWPALAAAYQELRTALGKPDPPLTAIVSAFGELDPAWAVFRSGATPVLIVTTAQGAQRLNERRLPRSVQVAVLAESGLLSARSILAAVCRACAGGLILTEGGPHLLGSFYTEHCLDEQFLTVAPQVAGRDRVANRPGFVAGTLFAPDHYLWGKLAGVKRSGDYLFLRYAFPATK